MKASILLAVSGAAVALAGPVEKRVMHTEVVTNIVYVTVTEDPDAPATKQIFNAGKHKYFTTTTLAPVTTEAPPPPPPPAPVVEVPAPAPEVPAPAPEPPAPETQSAPPALDLPAAPSNDFASVATWHHNVHRGNHSCGDVSFSDQYAGYAAITAATCHFAHDTATGGGGYGQNIAMYAATGDVQSIGESKIVAQAITDMWYNGEFELFPGFGSAPDMGGFEQWGHLSQVIWKDTQQIGCAVQLCKAGTMFDSMDAWFTVCNYYPAGNVGGGYVDNVLAPLGKATITA